MNHIADVSPVETNRLTADGLHLLSMLLQSGENASRTPVQFGFKSWGFKLPSYGFFRDVGLLGVKFILSDK
jgi:hypothetical protein